MFARSIGEIYILRFVVGLGAGGEYGIGMALVAEAFPKERRGQMSSWITVGGQMGTLIAALIAATVIPLAGWRAAFILELFQFLWLTLCADIFPKLKVGS